jgi:hypothetical protein
LDSDGDDARETTKRMRIENCYSEKLESASKCDKDGGNVLVKERDGKAIKAQRQEAGGKAVSETGEEVSAMDKESSGQGKVSETDKDCNEVDKEDGERDKEGSEKDMDTCGVEKDKVDRDTSKDGEVVSSCSKRAHEPVGLIEVKKVRISPEMEKQLKLVEGKNNSAEKPQNGEEKQDPLKSAPLKEPKSNLDLAIERVATGVTDEPEKTKPPEPTRKLNPMPFMRDLHQNLLKKLSRNVSLLALCCYYRYINLEF